jgi:hypothetical protein
MVVNYGDLYAIVFRRVMNCYAIALSRYPRCAHKCLGLETGYNDVTATPPDSTNLPLYIPRLGQGIIQPEAQAQIFYGKGRADSSALRVE